MAAKKKSSKGLSTTQKVGFGVGLTTAAVAAAGAYFLYGSPQADKNRKKVKSWMLKAKAEVLETLESAQEMSKEEYDALIENVAMGYAQLKDASKVDISEFKKEMKSHWDEIAKSAKPKKVAKKAVKKATKAAKKTTKKAGAATTKKTTKQK